MPPGGLRMRRLLLLLVLAASAAAAQTETLLYADDFARSIAPDDGLGPDWSLRGLWYTDGNAVADLDGVEQALEVQASCGDCRVEAQLIGAAPETGVSLRAATPDDRYDAVVLADGTVRIRRVNAGVPTTLAEGPGGLADPTSPFTLSLSAAGSNPVALVAAVNGAAVAAAGDADPAALGASGPAGLWTLNTGVRFAAFRLYAPAAPPPPPGDWPLYRHDLAGTGASSEALTTAQARSLRVVFQARVRG